MTNAQRSDLYIAEFQAIKERAEMFAEQLARFRARTLVPWARRHGYRKAGSYLLAGARHQALLTRDLDVLIARQDLARRLPLRLQRAYLDVFFKPNELLKLAVRNGLSRAKSRDLLPARIRRLLKKARHWRVAWLHLEHKGRSARRRARS